ncbi:MAG: isoprenylcysteine carboxylmethyltransferase family protein [Candidatus Omnitrophota bacterium]
MKRRLKINGFITFCAVVLIAFFPALFFRKATRSFFDEIMEVWGVAFILLGQIFRASGRGFKSEQSGKGSHLIHEGPYALVRNPMYLGILLIGLGIVLVLFNGWVASIFLAVFMVRYLLLIFKEEKNLMALFPQDFPRYQQQVPRLFPSLAVLSQKDVSEYLPLKLSWIKREIGSILTVLCLTLLLESWEDIKSEGVTVYLQEATGIFITILLFVALAVYLSRKTGGSEKYVSNKGKTAL